jgi:acetylornithine deacetylase/succinyl-diaminopimelate desuccinylase-like protein
MSGDASMEVDMRSEDAASLASVDAKVQKILRDALTAENARWTGPRAAAAKLSLVVDTMGIRPTGGQSDSARIVQTAIGAGQSLGFMATTGASSTDANIPISLGVPGIRLGGGGKGEGAHSLGESYDDGQNGYLGPQWALLVVTALAGVKP